MAGSCFGQRVDSSFHSAGGITSIPEKPYILLHNGVSRFHDHRFTLRSQGTGHVYDLPDLVVKRETCNSCFPYHPASNFFDQLHGYSVNRRPEFGRSIIIRQY